MKLALPERALLIKLYCLNQCNVPTALRELRTWRNLRKGRLSINTLEAMIKKFEETKSLKIHSSEGSKPASKEITDVAIIDGLQGNIAGVSNTRKHDNRIMSCSSV
ncbi:hypothetical protein TNCV_1911731 [Trichonephila clavipes]|nr:hypothetical protein TNCV_1911731 [Trichonephila clavipes]